MSVLSLNKKQIKQLKRLRNQISSKDLKKARDEALKHAKTLAKKKSLTPQSHHKGKTSIGLGLGLLLGAGLIVLVLKELKKTDIKESEEEVQKDNAKPE